MDIMQLQQQIRLNRETFDDYSYTAETSQIKIEALDLAALLDDFVKTEPRNGVTLRMRKL